jgi:uncharacterized protein (DUF1501 family)
MTDQTHQPDQIDRRADQTCPCPDYGMTRRSLLRIAAVSGGGAVAATMFGDTFRQVAYGGTDSNVVVVLSLRGGADFLSLVVPHSEPAYYQMRPDIAVPRGALVAQDATFGLHPSFKPLLPMWSAGKMAVVVATGLPQPNRSHFSAIEEIEDADLGSNARTGWLNRLIGLDAGRSPLQGIHMGSGMVPTSQFGPQPTLAAAASDDLQLYGGNTTLEVRQRRRRALGQVWRGSHSALGKGAIASLQATRILQSALGSSYRPAHGAHYPVTSLGNALSDSARLIKARVGVESVALDYGSWDMHAHLGGVDAIGDFSLTQMANELFSALAAFFADLGPQASRVTLVTLTEFGRRLQQNGSLGLDHGWANSTLVLGGGVKGGRYYGTWPGLSLTSLEDGDLKVTTDYRSVLSEILNRRLGVSTTKVFPNFTPERVGFMS